MRTDRKKLVVKVTFAAEYQIKGQLFNSIVL